MKRFGRDKYLSSFAAGCIAAEIYLGILRLLHQPCSLPFAILALIIFAAIGVITGAILYKKF